MTSIKKKNNCVTTMLDVKELAILDSLMKRLEKEKPGNKITQADAIRYALAIVNTK